MPFTQFVDPQKTALAVGAVNATGSPKKTLSVPDGSGDVYSLQPDLTFQTRPAGSAGPYEQCDVDGQVATWWYVWTPQGGSPTVVGPYSVAFFKVTGKS